MRQFYLPELTKENTRFTLPIEESKHISRVLRMKNGDEIQLLNGKGLVAVAAITDNNPKATEVDILRFEEFPLPAEEIHIAIAPTKNNDRIEYFLEKATEIGVTKVSLLLTDNAERNKVKLDRFEKIFVSAMKQSKRVHLPILEDLVKTKDFINAHPNGLIAHCYEDTKTNIFTSFKAQSCPIIIGPEGDFSEQELALAKEKGYTPITLGENRLRTETAGLYAVTVARLWLDMNS
ncbi:16S rRNA (uracil1498-N3)-methyltransferase [Lishizhenia tianjinensis]|uniref:Ribosomal RNA small subunit methyltransferase E n=1 Tax=Lishizhenia tianjinensis TaxID=477690 RepID=A0A1I6YK02_9FLAO|nr:RsmE family RNA methyltransferase [Lishizhenia tianjinensis]SFT50772.1 16S rRNA (uracil1498-N3)-methyltransferase [Lishizhenia tianjinensis]